jgi:hypothetical protein
MIHDLILMGHRVPRELTRPWRIHVVRHGERYGHKDALVNERRASPLIEFWDLSITKPPFGKDGQFVSRYYFETLMTDRKRLERSGLDLEGREPAWKVDGPFMVALYLWLEAVDAVEGLGPA